LNRGCEVFSGWLVSARNGCAPSVDRCREEIDHLPSTTGQGIKAAGLKDYRVYQVLVRNGLGIQKALLIICIILYFNEHLISLISALSPQTLHTSQLQKDTAAGCIRDHPS
jgi:hypothetical protein